MASLNDNKGKDKKKKKNAGSGSYIAFDSGTVMRSYPSKIGNSSYVGTESIDTTGYSSGKKNFKLKKGRATFPSSGGFSFFSDGSENVPRRKVLQLLKTMKEGASRKIDLRKEKNKSKKGKRFKTYRNLDF